MLRREFTTHMIYLDRVLIDGSVTSLVFTVYVVGTLRWNYRWWLSSFPPALQDRLPPQTTHEKQRGIFVAMGTLAIFLLSMLVSLMLLKDRSSSELTFLMAWLHTYLLWQVVNIWDLIIIDWAGFLLIDPKDPPFPGTANSSGYRDYLFHFIGFIKGSVLGIFISLLPATAAFFL